jgi:hypothetical protein
MEHPGFIVYSPFLSISTVGGVNSVCLTWLCKEVVFVYVTIADSCDACLLYERSCECKLLEL